MAAQALREAGGGRLEGHVRRVAADARRRLASGGRRRRRLGRGPCNAWLWAGQAAWNASGQEGASNGAGMAGGKEFKRCEEAGPGCQRPACGPPVSPGGQGSGAGGQAWEPRQQTSLPAHPGRPWALAAAAAASDHEHWR